MFNKKHTLFTEKYRPDTLEGYIGNDDFKSSLQTFLITPQTHLHSKKIRFLPLRPVGILTSSPIIVHSIFFFIDHGFKMWCN